jgi:phosphatidylserine/phosphatidylglycerophosphate/cardiolipin synthase-like enzyme
MLHHPPSPSQSIFLPGANCCTVQTAGRASVLIDGKAYFSAVKNVFARACRQIVIIGWDFDSDVPLEPDNDVAHEPVGKWLRRLVEENKDLRIHILIWRNSLFYGSNDEPLMPFGDRWWHHPRIEFNLDGAHPVGACHHQKIVCVDGSVAFCGGMDITQRRWDDDDHRFRNPNRHDEDGDPSRPVHDVQIVVDGQAAAAVWEVAARRWELKTGKLLEWPDKPSLWPENLVADFFEHPVAISRTLPQYRAEQGVREIEILNLDLLRTAQDCIYIEAQYFALEGVSQILSDHLRNPDGPEVIVVTNGQWQGWVEKAAMGGKRDWLLNRLLDANPHDRLGFFFPVTGGQRERRIKVHSKVMIIDDRILRVGSANLNERSMGLDTECDISLEATTASAGACIRNIRNRLIAEHIGANVTELNEHIRTHGNVLDAIRAAQCRERQLKPLPRVSDAVASVSFLGSLLDPGRPLTFSNVLRLFGFG